MMRSHVPRPIVSLAAAALLAACGSSTTPNDSGVLPCSTGADCPDGWLCSGGVCVADDDGCTIDADCPAGQRCIDGRCRDEQPDGGIDGGDGGHGGDQAPEPPVIAVEPELIDFGNARIGESLAQPLVVRNAGGSALTLFSVRLETGTSEEFSAEPTGNFNRELAPGEELTVAVHYQPVDGVADQGGLLISSDDPANALLRVALSSSYKGTSELTVVDDPSGDLLEVETVDFGAVAVGSETLRRLVVLNSGTGNAVLTVEEVRTQPLSSDHFSLDSAPQPPVHLSPHLGACGQDADCPPDGQCRDGLCVDGDGVPLAAVAVEIAFAPAAVGAVQESLVITNDEEAGAGDETVRIIQLRGEGIQPALTVDPDPIDFGHLFVGQQAEQTVRLSNSGGQDLTISGIALTGGGPFGLALPGAPPWLLAPGEQLELTASFTPQAAGEPQDQLRIESDDPEGPALVDVFGSASQPPVLVVEPAALDFGEVQLAEQAQQHFLIRNTGGSPLSVLDLELIGGAQPFGLVQQAVPDIAPGESAQVDVTYAPSGAVGADSNLVRVTSNDPLQPEVLVELAGIGTDPELVLEPEQFDFGPIYQGYTAGPQPITVRNEGFGRLTIDAIALGDGSSPDFVLGGLPALPAALTSGQSLQIEVHFTPSGSGVRTAAVEVASSDRDRPLGSVALSGSGSDCPEGFWDINGDPADGCEYACDLTNGGIEACDGADNDCDGTADDGLTSRSCSVSNVYGTCTGSESCDGLNGWVNCDAATPEQEICDGLDNDCDTAVDAADNDLLLEPCAQQQGVCAGAVHRAAQCAGDHWEPCQALDYGADYGAEVCDGLDNDCDGLTDAADGDLQPELCELQQGVCAGASKPAALCLGEQGWAACGADEYAAHSPDYSASETCDGHDNDCNGLADASDPALVLTACALQDGVCAGSQHPPNLCVSGAWQPCGAAEYGADYGAEVCDGLDNDCDDQLDTLDADLLIPSCELQNGVCAGATKPLALCQGAGGWAACGADDYTAHDARYGAEQCDGVDNDCNGLADASDGALVLTACALQDGVCAGSQHLASRCVSGAWQPCGAAEYGADYGAEICDGLDNDCDGDADIDDNSLLIPDCENQTGVCAGAAKPAALCQGAGGWAACGPDEYEAHDPDFGAESCDGHDNDCDGFVDAADGELVIALCEDQDGVCAGAEHRSSLCQGGAWLACEATDYEANDPDYDDSEICDGRDNNCDTQVDEGLSTRPCSLSNAYGECFGSETCDGLNGWVNCDAATPEQEICDGDDNDCDGYVDGADNSLELALCDLQAGVCAGAVHDPSQCNGVDWEPCTAFDYTSHDANYGVEVCGNALDEDCSGAVNDKDVDADGYVDVACSGGDDCDDDDPATYPNAAEVQDAADNDCDGLVDEGLIPAGAVIVSEIMHDPDGVLDSVGEWFEVTNDWTEPVNLHSWTIYDFNASPDVFNVVAPAGIVIDAGETAVFCINADAGLNGGVVCDYDFDNFQLANSGDEVVLALDGAVIDIVDYDDPSFPDPTGESMSLDPAAYDAAANDDGANWCTTPTDAAYALASGDHGTPGQFNPSCAGALAVLDVNPDSGIELGGEIITITGAGFSGATAVSVGGQPCLTFTVDDDSTITCISPALAPGDHDVTVTKGANSETLTDGFRTTGEQAAPGIGWCVLQWPESTTTSSGAPSELIFGRVYKAGVTEPAGPPPGIGAQIGYGPLDSDPRTTPGWRWVAATWNPSCPDCGNDDEFMESLTVTIPGQYSYAVRFSEDGGYHYTFCDLPPGTDDGFSSAELGTLTVNP